MPDTFAIGVDVGATKIAAASVNAQGEVIAAAQVPTDPADGSVAVLDRIAAQINSLADRVSGSLIGVGIGTPGQVDPINGIVRDAVNLGWCEVYLANEIRSRLALNRPLWVHKDTNAGALGEYLFGAARGCDDFVYLTIGSGLGGGVIANGQLIIGTNHNASELGHLSLDPNGRECVCGLRGCAETIVSGRGLIAITREYLAAQKFSTRLIDSPQLSTTDVIDAARLGDALALAAIEEVARSLGIVIAVCVAVLNPARIVIGGGLACATADWLPSGAERELQRRVLPKSYQQMPIVLSAVASSAVGAASLVWSNQPPTLVYSNSQGGL
jgi:glucokinase